MSKTRKKTPRRKDGGEDFRNVPGDRVHVPKNKGKPRSTEKQNWKREYNVE